MPSDSTPGAAPRSVERPARARGLPLDRRGYPIIATVGRTGDAADFGSISEQRKLALATFDLCAVCGKPFGSETRWQVALDPVVLDRPRPVFGEAPVHEICALYAAQVCPFVSSPYARLGDEIRRGQRRPEIVYLLGYSRTVSVFGHRSGLQSDTGVLHFEMAKRVAEHAFRTATEAAQVYRRAIREEPELPLAPGEQALADLMNNPEPAHGEDAGGVLAGAAWYVGAAFCPGIFEVQGMHYYATHPTYTEIAQRLIIDPDEAQRMTAANDAATTAAMTWLVERHEIPEVLRRWHRRGQRNLGAGGQRPNTPSGQRKNRRKTETSSRRKNRR